MARRIARGALRISSTARAAVISGAALATSIGCEWKSPSGAFLEVEGAWTETSTKILDTCGDVEVPVVAVDRLTIEQDGERITFVLERESGTLTVTGTFFPQSGIFTLTFPDTGIPGNTVVQSGRFMSSSRYTSETVISFTPRNCAIRTSDEGQRLMLVGRG